MPKTHRGPAASALRSHSRSSSGSKLTANLQFTQKEQLLPKLLDKPKKNGATHDNTQLHARGIARVASGQRVHTRDTSGPKQRNSTPSHNHKTKTKPGFTISTPGGEGDEDGWVSSESGAATPNDLPGSQSESDDAPDEEELIQQLIGEQLSHTARTNNGPDLEALTLPRTETARPSDFRTVIDETSQPQSQHGYPEARPGTRTPTLPPIKTSLLPHLQHVQAMNHYPSNDRSPHDQSPEEDPSPVTPFSRSSGKRQGGARPSSSHSMRADHPLRPHPLIRGHSYGQVAPAKPSPLQPLTVIQDTSTATSPDNILNGNISISPPSSIKTETTSPSGPSRDSSSQHRRSSVSSSRSVATLPVHPGLKDSINWSLGDRRRTLSTMSHSSSSAALSSLTHLPTFTRPPSPQAIVFFPPVNPHANIDGIHPLLPGPYLNNHLTVLSRRTPVKESFDRVIRVKQVRP